MAQDIRELLKKEGQKSDVKLREGHAARFTARLEKELPVSAQETDSSAKGGIYLWMKIAAVFVIAGGVVWMVWNSAFAKADSETQFVETKTEQPAAEKEVLLSNISPDFKLIEQKYLASVNSELSRLEITDDNKELVDAFLKQLASLDKEYKRLNLEITESGVSEEMVNALIENLQLRVALMIKLKAKLKELKAEADQANAVQTV
ncbi:hypothetical protein EAX61_07200 [Dokdonia sinensis]|uniref:Anti-sigma factor n=1 Tax=Dokdonia sinensis TaxID=2479847 RepID=A0A3M0G6B3_9FLAO|nr:hypothetical protein [Dokdonia sinensis]RMB60600.1 hypothetical protein EAX61_07200 [Dokdonia sinensis]